MMTLELRFLGGLTIHREDQPLMALKSQKGQALLCYLAMTGKAHARSVLAGLLWPEMPEDKALMNLRAVLNKLNDHLAPHLAITRQTIAWNPATSYWLDVAEFEAGLAVKEDIGRLQTAVALYQGDFLEGFDLDDAPQFEGWVLGQRARLREAALTALHHLVTHFASKGTSDMAIAYVRQLLTIEPWREEAHRDLMRLLALSGQRSAALVQFETSRRILAEELGVEPAPATVALYRKIKENQVTEVRPRTLLLPSPSDREPPAPPLLHNLPSQSTPLIGRETELAKLNERLAKSDGRLITIVGTGGMGKTRLALAVAGQQITQPPNSHNQPFTDGIYFVPLSPLSEATHILPTLAQSIGFQIQPGDRRTPQQQVIDYLRRKRMMLLFDNFEHVLEGAGLLVDILQAAPQVEILVTSREPLRLYEEQLFSLKALAFSEGMVAEEDAAVQLFLQRAQWMQPDYVVQETDLPELTKICRQTGGIPLALELAAAWVDTLTLAEIAGEMVQSLDLLRTKWRNVPDRHRSIRAAFELSWHRLVDEEQQIFGRLCVFRGGFSRVAAWQVCAPEMNQTAFQRILAALADKSLLRVISTPDRYDLHELLRQFAAEKLAQTPDEETVVCDRHSAYYCTFLHEQTENWHNSNQLETLAAVTYEADNAQLAWRWALQHEAWLRLEEAIYSWVLYHGRRGLRADGEAYCQAVCAGLEQWALTKPADAAAGYRLWAKAMAWYGEFALSSQIAVQRVQQSLDLLARPELAAEDTRSIKAFTLLCFGSYTFNPHTERSYIEESLNLYEALQDSWGIGSTLGRISALDWAMGNYDLAQQEAEASLDISRKRGDLGRQANTLSLLGAIYQHRGQPEEAEQFRRKALDLEQRLGYSIALSHDASDLAFTLFFQGKFDEGMEWGQKGLHLSLEHSDPMLEEFARLAIGWSNLHLGQYEQAQQELTRSLALVRVVNNRYDEISVLCSLGYVALVNLSYDKAQAAFEEGYSLNGTNQFNPYTFNALSGLGLSACFRGDLDQSRRHFIDLLTEGLRRKDFLYLLFALPGLALYLARRGEVERATTAWALAQRYPFVANSKWYEDMVGRELEALAASMPPEVAEAARERGRALDLWETAEALLGELDGASEV